jgi:hypothetical protein
MITRLIVKNFKTLEFADIPLGQNVVLIGPNNSGKTSALQSLALWSSGLREWSLRRPSSSNAKKRVGVTVNRKSLTHTPVAISKHLWNELRVTSQSRENGSLSTKNVHIEITVEGETSDKKWTCALEFQHVNTESFLCRPLKVEATGEWSNIPEDAFSTKLALLPPMSGLVSEEPEIQPGRVAVLIGEGQTAQVLRNLCYQVFQASPDSWKDIVEEMKRTFGIELTEPRRDASRGTIEIQYIQNGIELGLPSAGRGLQQTLLLLAHLYANPGSVLLLDEPDAHLEILRQRQLYQLITETARKMGSQVIAASHSEILLNEAADKDVVVAFVGKPHRIDDRGSQVLKSLKQIGFDQYYQAEQKGFVLYLEGATDLSILRAFARKLGHPAFKVLDEVFVHYVSNQPTRAAEHYHGLREAKRDLQAVAIFDKLEREMPVGFGIPTIQWERREIENYLCSSAVLLRYAEGMEIDDLVGLAQKNKRRDAMLSAIGEVEAALKVLDKDPWSPQTKVSDEVLPIVFKRYFSTLGIDDKLNKTDFHILADYVNKSEIDPEIEKALDLILIESKKAKPRQ